MIKKADSRKKHSQMEQEILKFWKENKIFEKSIKNRPEDKAYSFYDGPPFITGVPHYGTLLSSAVKDCVPRYWTMKGYRVERRWGWDCHGLPAEHMVEKKLGVEGKGDIESKIGIREFNKTCFRETSKIASEWEGVIDRIGRWVDLKGAYKTMDKDYMESVWWVFGKMHEKGLVYEDSRISLYCPRCATPLSNFEIAMDNSYKMDTDTAVFVKLEIDYDLKASGSFFARKSSEKVYFLAWTTTPWTLLANVALAVNEKLEYVMVKNTQDNNVYVLAKNKIHEVFGNEAIVEEIQSFRGSDLIGLKYKPLFEIKESSVKSYFVVGADFVSADNGTGIVHLAPAFGEDDFNCRKEHNLPIILNVDADGCFIEGKWKGEKVWEANDKIVQYLEDESFLFKKDSLEHSYPHCYRCDSKLIYKTQPAWFIDIDKIREKLIKNNQEINWHPAYFKNGRFKIGLENAPDWSVSRDRYWGTAIPVWKCENKNCDNMRIFSSYRELGEESGIFLEDYHRPYVDEIELTCEKCQKKMHRVPQVFDCWMESGSMPFAQFHYPFENEEVFKKSFPTDFVSEYVGQVRAWFYVLHVLSTAVFDSHSFKNVIVTGNIAGSDGKKMSKSLGNYTDPKIILEQYSADALRFYLLSSPLLNSQDLSFSDESVRDLQRKFLGTLWNSYSFFTLYASVDSWEPAITSEHEVDHKKNLLDRWIISELNNLIREVDFNMKNYDLVSASKPMKDFVDNLSNWYIRRSRRRFWKSDSDADKNEAYKTLWTVLVEFSKVLAPFCPFVCDEIYRNLTGRESVHLVDFPIFDDQLIDSRLGKDMLITRKIVELGLSLRAEDSVKVRQPLEKLVFASEEVILDEQFLELIKQEVNVKQVLQIKESDGFGELKIKEFSKLKVGLKVEISKELKQEGLAREIIRRIQSSRKELGLEVEDRIILYYQGFEVIFEFFNKEISKETLTKKLKKENPPEDIFKKEIEIEGEKLIIGIEKSLS